MSKHILVSRSTTAPAAQPSAGDEVVRAGGVWKRFGEGVAAVDALRGVDILFAWLTTYALDDLGLRFAVAAGRLLVFGGLAIVVGVVAAIVPARRAARLDILRAVASGE
jgi:hypothetical protein